MITILKFELDHEGQLNITLSSLKFGEVKQIIDVLGKLGCQTEEDIVEGTKITIDGTTYQWVETEPSYTDNIPRDKTKDDDEYEDGYYTSNVTEKYPEGVEAHKEFRKMTTAERFEKIKDILSTGQKTKRQIASELFGEGFVEENGYSIMGAIDSVFMTFRDKLDFVGEPRYGIWKLKESSEQPVQEGSEEPTETEDDHEPEETRPEYERKNVFNQLTGKQKFEKIREVLQEHGPLTMVGMAEKIFDVNLEGRNRGTFTQALSAGISAFRHEIEESGHDTINGRSCVIWKLKDTEKQEPKQEPQEPDTQPATAPDEPEETPDHESPITPTDEIKHFSFDLNKQGYTSTQIKKKIQKVYNEDYGIKEIEEWFSENEKISQEIDFNALCEMIRNKMKGKTDQERYIYKKDLEENNICTDSHSLFQDLGDNRSDIRKRVEGEFGKIIKFFEIGVGHETVLYTPQG